MTLFVVLTSNYSSVVVAATVPREDGEIKLLSNEYSGTPGHKSCSSVTTGLIEHVTTSSVDFLIL